MTLPELKDILDRMYASYPNNPPSPFLINDYFAELEAAPAEAVWQAFRKWREQNDNGFPPTVGAIVRQVKRLMFPRLFLTFEEAKAQDAPLYHRAVRAEGSLVKRAYDPYADPATMLQSKDVPFALMRVRKVYEEMQEDKAAKPLAQLVEIQRRNIEKEPRWQAKLAAVKSRERLPYFDDDQEPHI